MYTLKGDIVNSAYSKLRISGLTKQPTPEDNELAMMELESIANELTGLNLCVGFNFEPDPDPGSKHGTEMKYFSHLASILAARLLPNFGKGFQPDPILLRQASVAWSSIASMAAQVKQAQYPSRMPIGSGNRRCYYAESDFYVPEATPPTSCDSHTLTVGEIDDYTESFESYLKDSEDVASYTILADTGITILSDSLATPIVSYRAQADSAVPLINVVITATTTTGRVKTKIINFQVVE